MENNEQALCQVCNKQFNPHCTYAKDTYYTCGCSGELCVDCHTDAEENQAERNFHDFHSA